MEPLKVDPLVKGLWINRLNAVSASRRKTDCYVYEDFKNCLLECIEVDTCTECSRSQEKDLEPRIPSCLGQLVIFLAALTATDVLEQLFDDDSDFSWSDSGRVESEEVYAYRGPTFSPSTSEQDSCLDETDSCKCYSLTKSLYIYHFLD